MRSGVVQVAGDPGAFFRGGQPAFTFGLALGPLGALLEVSEVLATLPQLVTDDPDAAPEDDRPQDRGRGEATVGDRRGAEVDRPESEHNRCGVAHPIARAPVGGDAEQGDGRSHGRAERVAERVDRCTGDRAQREHGQRRASALEQREAGDRREQDAQWVEATAGAVTGGEQAQGQRECDRGEGAIACRPRAREPVESGRAGTTFAEFTSRRGYRAGMHP